MRQVVDNKEKTFFADFFEGFLFEIQVQLSKRKNLINILRNNPTNKALYAKEKAKSLTIKFTYQLLSNIFTIPIFPQAEEKEGYKLN